MSDLGGALRRALSVVARISLFVLLASFASCARPTVFPHYLTVADVINNVKCELYQAIWQAISENPKSIWLDPWTAKFSVQLQVKRETVGNGEFTFVVPYNVPVGLFTLAVGGTADKSGQSHMVFDFLADKNLKTFRSIDQCNYPPQLNSRNNLAGETGLRPWFTNVIAGFNEAHVKSASLTYNLEFVTTLDGHIKPSFKSTYPSKKIFAGDFGIDHKRTDDNMLTIVFSPPAPGFAATNLGKALAAIEAELAKARKDKGTAKSALDKASGQYKAQLQSIAPEAARTPAQIQAQVQAQLQAQLAVTNAENEVNRLDNKITNLETKKEIARARAIGQAGAVSTDQQLNNLLLLDAIRGIPR